MKSTKNDVRSRFTQTTIKKSLLKLLSDTPLKNITVSELCKEAGITRGTFYNHFYDVYDIYESIENEFFETVAAKLELAERCYRQSVPIISCMGTGNKLRPELLKLGDIFETSVCPLCRVMRHELKKRGVPELRALYSTETPVSASRPPLSAPFVPSVAGLLIAADMIKRLIRPADGK